MYCYFVLALSFYLSDLGDPTRNITPVSKTIQVNEVRNPHHHKKVTACRGWTDLIRRY